MGATVDSEEGREIWSWGRGRGGLQPEKRKAWGGEGVSPVSAGRVFPG